jgi:hypothetical protein
MVMGAFHRWRSRETGAHGHAYLTLYHDCLLIPDDANYPPHTHMLIFFLSSDLLHLSSIKLLECKCEIAYWSP